MKIFGINFQRNVSKNLKLHVIEWKDGSERDLMLTLQNKLQLLYSSMEVLILPMPTRMQLINSHCVILSMQDLLGRYLSFERWLQSLANHSNLKILVSLQNRLVRKVIYLKMDDFFTLSIPMGLIPYDFPLEKVITGQVAM